MLVLALLLVAALFGSAAGQTVSCMNAGYDLTSITGSDLIFNGTGNAAGTGTVYLWAIRPCGTVTTAGFCTGQPGEFCQGSTTVSSMNVSGAAVGSGAVWGQIQLNGQYGVAQFLQDGTSCGSGVGDREGTIVYLCNATATTPFISSVIEETTCHYQAVVQTSAICSQVPSNGFASSLGTTIISNQCGGGIYDLTSINQVDINTYVNGNTWAIRPCGTVTSTQACNTTANVSVCQYGSNYGYVAAVYQPTLIPTFYQYAAPNSVTQVIQDGAACGNQMRYTNITFVCNATASTPVITSALEPVTCHYYLTVQTSATCGSAFVNQPVAGSSTSSPVVGGQSSATSVQVTVTSAPVVTSTASPTAPVVTSTASPTAPVVTSTGSPTAPVVTSTGSPTAPVVTSTGSPTAPVVTSTASAPASNPGNGVAAASSVSLMAMVICALTALVLA